jgi:hypothetical protein
VQTTPFLLWRQAERRGLCYGCLLFELFIAHRQHLLGAAIFRCFDGSEFRLGGGWDQDFERRRTIRLPRSFDILNHVRTSQPFIPDGLKESLQ